MKTKIIFLSILFFLSFMSLQAQMSYYYRGEKVFLLTGGDECWLLHKFFWQEHKIKIN